MINELLHSETQQLRIKVQSLEQKLDQLLTLQLRIAEEVSQKQFYSIQEFSILTGLKPTTVKNYCLQGILKATQAIDGGKWMIYRAEVERLKAQAAENHFNERKHTTRRDNLVKNSARNYHKK